VIPTLAILDELHRHRDLRLYRTWVGKLGKRGGQMVAISTAGEPNGEFEDTRDQIAKRATSFRVKGAHLRAASDDVVIHDWAVRDRDRVGDMRAVKQANPLRAITLESLRAKRESPTMTDAHWMRFTCNVPTREDGQGILPEAWDALRVDGEADRSAWAIGCLDLGWKVDTSAVGVLVWESDDRRRLVAPTVLEPPVDESDVVRAILAFQREYEPVGWVYDPNAGAQQMVQLLEKGAHPLQAAVDAPPLEFFTHTQDNAHISLASARFDEAVRNGWIVHDGDATLRRHVLNAVRVPLPADRWRYDRPPDVKTSARRRKYPIDALTAFVMGHSVAMAEHERVVRVPLVAFG